MIQFNYNNIIKISKDGIQLEDKNNSIFISFSECTQHYAIENSLPKSNCVATRDITVPIFTFYSNPKVSANCKCKLDTRMNKNSSA